MTKTTKNRTIYLAISGVSDRSFHKYSEACAWLDKISPETANRGFETEDGGEDEGVRTVFVRHAN